MMKKIKTLKFALICALACACALCLIGCGKKDPGPQAVATFAPSAETSKVTPPAALESAEPAATTEPAASPTPESTQVVLESTQAPLPTQTPSTATEAESDPGAASLVIGATQTQGDISFTVNSVRYDTRGTRPPLDGNVYLIANIKVINNSSRTQTLSSLLCYSLLQSGDSSVSIEPTLTASQQGNLDEPIAPGASITGEVAFEVPKNYDDYLLSIKTDMLSNNALIFDLSHHDEHPEHTLADVWNIGDTADIGRLKYTVSSVRSVAASKAKSSAPASELLLISITVMNPLDTPIAIDISSTFSLLDKDLTAFSPTTNVSASPLPEGEILPGQSISGEISFLVPESDYTLQIKPDPTRDETILFSLKN